MTVFLSNTNLLQLKSLRRESDSSLIAGANVQVTVKDSSGVPLAGMVWPSLMADAGGGNYELTLPNALTWIAGAEYTAFIDATTVAGVGHWEFHFFAKSRVTS